MRLSTIIPLVPLALAAKAPLYAAADDSVKLIEDKYIVKLKDEISVSALDDTLLTLTADADHVYSDGFKGFATTLDAEALDALRDHPDVRYMMLRIGESLSSHESEDEDILLNLPYRSNTLSKMQSYPCLMNRRPRGSLTLGTSFASLTDDSIKGRPTAPARLEEQARVSTSSIVALMLHIRYVYALTAYPQQNQWNMLLGAPITLSNGVLSRILEVAPQW